jgi:hypothetical protein
LGSVTVFVGRLRAALPVQPIREMIKSGVTMNQSQAISLLPKLRRFNQKLRVFFICLVGLNLILLAFSLPSFLRGEPDMYHNQHLRSVVGTCNQLLLCLGSVFCLSAQLSNPTPSLSVRQKILWAWVRFCSFAHSCVFTSAFNWAADTNVAVHRHKTPLNKNS